MSTKYLGKHAPGVNGVLHALDSAYTRIFGSQKPTANVLVNLATHLKALFEAHDKELVRHGFGVGQEVNFLNVGVVDGKVVSCAVQAEVVSIHFDRISTARGHEAAHLKM